MHCDLWWNGNVYYSFSTHNRWINYDKFVRRKSINHESLSNGNCIDNIMFYDYAGFTFCDCHEN